MKPNSILLVDDDAAFRRVMASELERRGYSVTAASSGDEALARVAEAEPEVVLLDMRMPGMNGLDALKAIRNGHSSPEVILVTGHGTIDTAIEAIRMGAFDYVLKPCPLDELVIRIERALERRSLRHRVPARAASHRARCAERFDRIDFRRDRGRQGDGGKADPLAKQKAVAAVRSRRMRRAAGEPAAKRAVRSREGRLHGSGSPETWPV